MCLVQFYFKVFVFLGFSHILVLFLWILFSIVLDLHQFSVIYMLRVNNSHNTPVHDIRPIWASCSKDIISRHHVGWGCWGIFTCDQLIYCATSHYRCLGMYCIDGNVLSVSFTILYITVPSSLPELCSSLCEQCFISKDYM